MTPTAKLLASHISSNGRFQFGLTITGAHVSLSFNNSNAFWHSSSNSNVVSFSSSLVRGHAIFEKSLMNRRIDVIDEILEEDFDALLNEGSKILHFIEGTFLEEEIFAKFNEFMAMTADENSDSESNTEE
uniref:Reverse transcriptase domain-containing protein n=1 Tax=Tanacetum cinerariifolium TaxID=118510 RepID=A0A699KUF0_TANCI|nr:reverse transcriptase domain-containing protein [Tanacetum cinerariifolium]